MSDDIRSILERLALVEGTTPVNVKHGLNSQQKSVHQLPALFKPHGIRVLGSKTDPQHPMHKELVGDSVEPEKSALEEAMQEVEEDMLSKVKKDLTQYLDQLEQKVRIDRELKDKAVDAVEKGQAEEEIEEDDYELTDPSTVHGIEDKVDTQLGNPQQPINDMSETSSAPVKSYTMEDGVTFECYGNEKDGFELRQGDRSMPSKFKNLDHADMAVKLFQKRRAMKQQAQQASQQDYLDER